MAKDRSVQSVVFTLRAPMDKEYCEICEKPLRLGETIQVFKEDGLTVHRACRVVQEREVA